MRTYELMIITHGSLDDATVQATVDRFTKLIADHGGEVDTVDHWGKRAFAYEIDHMREGYYTVIEFDLGPDGLSELQRQLGITDEVVRYKLVRPGARVKRAS